MTALNKNNKNNNKKKEYKQFSDELNRRGMRTLSVGGGEVVISQAR